MGGINLTQPFKHCLKIRILADNEQQARARFTHGATLLLIGRINPTHQQRAIENAREINRTFGQRSPAVDVKADNVKIHSLPKGEDVGSIAGTISKNGTRTRQNCGFFMPQIPFSHVPEKSGALSYIEFAARLRGRNKAEFIRTNNARRFFAVVDHLVAPFAVDKPQNTKQRENPMKIYSQSDRTLAALPALSVSVQGGVYVD